VTNVTVITPPIPAAPRRKHRGHSFSYVTWDWRVEVDREDLGALFELAWDLMDKVEAKAPHLDLIPMWEPLLGLLGELEQEINR
jgi:hypothetical protein